MPIDNDFSADFNYDFVSGETYSIVFDEIVTETKIAWLIDIDCVEIWFPKSLCTIDDNYITMPYWLAEEKELI